MTDDTRAFLEAANKKYLTTKQLRERWGGCSHMLIERRMKSDPRFPQPMQFGRRWRLWPLDQIEAYERALVVRKGAA
jgi:hypothetical protein